MKYEHCKLCNYEDHDNYLHPLYDGESNRCIVICEKCRENIFSYPERSKREDRGSGCGALNTDESQ